MSQYQLSMSENFQTRNSLLIRAKNPKDQQAWEEFVKYYKTFIFMLLRQMNISQHDCEDLTQTVLIKIWKKLETFDPKRAKFRTWLSTVIRNTVFNHWSAQKSRSDREGEYGGHSALTKAPPSGLPSSPEFEAIFQREWEAYLANKALTNIQGEFKARAMEIFEMSLKSMSTAEIAEKLEVNASTVTRSRNSVRDRLIQEVRRLSQELEL